MVKIYFLFLPLLFCSWAMGQDKDGFAELQTSFQKFDAINSPLGCELYPEDRAEMVCTRSDENGSSHRDDSRLVYKVTDLNQVPDILKNELPLPNKDEVSKKRPLYISLWYDNDNILFDAVKGGNDLGYTTGLKLEVVSTDKNGISSGAYIYTGLYSERRLKFVNEKTGEVSYQKFTDWKHAKAPKDSYLVKDGNIQSTYFNEDTVLAAFVNNKNQGEWFTWSLEGGVGKIESQKKSKFLASGIQDGWHKMLGLVQYRYLPDDKDSVYSAHLKTLVGGQKALFDNASCSLVINGDFGGSVSNVSERRYFMGHVEANLGLFKASRKTNEKLVTIAVGSEGYMGTTKQASATGKLSINFHRIILTNQFFVPLTSGGFSNNVNAKYVDKDVIHRMGIVIPIR